MSMYGYLKTKNGFYLPVYDYSTFQLDTEYSMLYASNHSLWENFPNFNESVRFDLVNNNYCIISLEIESEHTATGKIEFYDNEDNLIYTLTDKNTAVHAPYKDFAGGLAYDSANDVLYSIGTWGVGLYGSVETTQPGIYPTAFAIFKTIGWAQGINIDFETWSDGAIVENPPFNPYDPGETSDVGGGEGDFDKSSDPVPVPSLPSLSAVDTGFITLFNPTLAQIKSLANYMWSTGFDLDTFKKLFANPMDAIMGLSIVPVTIPSGGSRAVTVGNISTGVNMNVAGNQYIEKDCGSITVPEFWGAYLDYAPYTKVEIFLPYIGTKTLDVDDVIGKVLQVVYHVDILSGGCVAMIKSDDHVVYSFTGQCAAQVPVTGADMNNLISSAIGAAAAIGGALVTGGAAIPVVAAAASTARAVVSAKPNIDRSGDMSGYCGLLGIQQPYLIISRPVQCNPLEQNYYSGYPAFITRYLSDLSGYTEVEAIHLAVPGASGPEIEEINQMLKEGVVL